MRRGVALAIALVVLLIASSLLVVPSAVRASPAPASARPAASDTIESTNVYGYYDTHFYTQLGSNDVYFYATDAVDTSATVAINDYNATRDGLTNPVATTTAHFTAGVNASYTSGIFLAIPLTVVYPGTWNITISGATAGFVFLNFTVQTYYVATNVNNGLALPGHTVTFYYNVLSEVNSAPYTHTTKLWATGEYWSNQSKWVPIPGLPAYLTGIQSGTYNYTLPLNASATGSYGEGYSYVDFYANTTGASVWWQANGADVYTGELAAPAVVLATCPSSGCDTTNFAAGSTIIATASEWIQSGIYGGVRQPAVGADLTLRYLKGTGSTATVVSPLGSPPTHLTVNTNGQVQWIFTADSTAFSTTAANTLNVTVSDPSVPTNKGPGFNVTFFVQRSTGVVPGLYMTFGAAQYYGGDTIFANWTLSGNSSVTNGWNATWWEAYFYVTGSYFDTVITQGTATGTSGEIQVVAPLGFTGRVYFDIQYSNATYSAGGGSSIPVSPPQILLTASEVYYLPGDSVTVTVTTLGSVLSSATLKVLVIDSYGDHLISGALTGSSMTVTIPMKAAPNYVEFTVFAVDSTGAIITNASLYVDEANGYDLSVGVTTKSNYADDSFQPGQTIQFSYQILARGTYSLPKAWTIWVWPEGAYDNTGLGAIEMQTTSTSGTISYTIPSSSANGIQSFEIEAEPSSGGYATYNLVSVNVESNPSGLGLELGAGSGLTVGWLILLIIIVVVAIVLFLAIRSHGRPKMMKPESGSPPSGSPPPQAWQEPTQPAPAADATPPASPPSGST